MPETRPRPLAAFCLAALLAAPLATSGAAESRDPAVAHVLGMLGSGASEAVVLRWVSAPGNAPRKVTAGDLVELAAAGATDDLLELMLALADEAPEGGLEALDRAAVAEVAAGEGSGTEVAVGFEIEYRPLFLAGEEEEPWDLYVYLDGEPLTWVSRGSQLSATPPVRFERRLAPGRHVLRLLQERHERRGERWRHQARVAPTEIVFQLEGVARAEVVVRVKQPRLLMGGLRGGSHGPVDVEVRQGERTLLLLRETGADLERWPELCEEVETEHEGDGGKLPRWLERRLERCLRWAEIWHTLGAEADVPDRNAARAALERYAYRPLAR